MKLFVDTGNVKEIEALAALGILDGVTTNPSLLAKEPGDYRQILKQICQLVQGPVSAEVVRSVKEPEFNEQLKVLGIDIVGGSRAELDAFRRTEAKRMGDIVKTANLDVK